MKDRIIIPNGPSGSGKSTLAHILQDMIRKKRGDVYEIVSIDDFLKMSAHETIYEDDVFEISPALLEAASCALQTRGGVIIDHVITSKRIFYLLTDTFGGCDVKLIRVTCPREVLAAREAQAGGTCGETV